MAKFELRIAKGREICAYKTVYIVSSVADNENARAQLNEQLRAEKTVFQKETKYTALAYYIITRRIN